MRRPSRAVVVLTIVAAVIVTASLAYPSRLAAGGAPMTLDMPASFAEAASAVQRTAVILSLLFVWILAAIAITLMSGREIRYSSVELRASMVHCFALGLVAFTSFILTAIVFSYLPSVVGVPLLIALAVFAIVAKVYGAIAVFHAVGTIVAGVRNRDDLARRRWLRGDLAMVVIGVLLLGAIRLIPLVGTIVWAIASLFGVGTALATKFGRREPWFLAADLSRA